MLGSLPILPLPAPPTDGDLGPLQPSQVQNEDQEVNDESNTSQPASIATHTRTIGIIHHPPDIRTIVDKTASFVAKNGPEFEKRIIVSNAGNPKFNFLNGSDPYHAYYQHRLSEFQAQNQTGWNLPAPAPAALPPVRPLPPPPGLLPRVPPNSQYSGMVTLLRPPAPPMQMSYGQHPAYRPPSIPVPPPPGSQFTPLAPRPFMSMPLAPPPMPLGMPPPEEAPPPLPEEPEPKKQRLDDSLLVPEDQFLAQHPDQLQVQPATSVGLHRQVHRPHHRLVQGVLWISDCVYWGCRLM